jgi:hypothetical protein
MMLGDRSMYAFKKASETISEGERRMSSMKFAAAVAFAGLLISGCSSPASISAPSAPAPKDGDTYAYDHVRVYTSIPVNATTVTNITASGAVTPTTDNSVPSDLIASLKCQAFVLGGNAVVLGDRYFVGDKIAVDDENGTRTTTTAKGYEIVKATVIKTVDAP